MFDSAHPVSTHELARKLDPAMLFLSATEQITVTKFTEKSSFNLMQDQLMVNQTVCNELIRPLKTAKLGQFHLSIAVLTFLRYQIE